MHIHSGIPLLISQTAIRWSISLSEEAPVSLVTRKRLPLRLQKDLAIFTAPWLLRVVMQTTTSALQMILRRRSTPLPVHPSW